MDNQNQVMRWNYLLAILLFGASLTLFTFYGIRKSAVVVYDECWIHNEPDRSQGGECKPLFIYQVQLGQHNHYPPCGGLKQGVIFCYPWSGNLLFQQSPQLSLPGESN